MRSWKNRDLALPCALTLACLAAAACGRRPALPVPGAGAAPVWNWLDFPRSERLALAPLSGLVEPAQMEVLKAPREGWFLLAPAFAGAKDGDEAAAAGQVVGRMAPGSEGLEAEAEALHAQAAKVEDELRRLREEEARETFAEQERQARRDIATYEAALKLAADPALRRDILPQADAASREEIDRIKARMAAAKERLEKTRAAAERQAALQKRQVELADAKAAFDRAQKAERDTVRTPFAGRLRFAPAFEPVPPAEADKAGEGDAAKGAAKEAKDGKDPAPRPAKRAYVRSDSVIAVLRDDAALWVKAEIGEAGLLSVPADRLVFAFTAAGEPVEAPFGGRAPESAAGDARSTPVYQFALKEATPQQIRLVGGVVAGQLVQKLSEAAYLVPKIRLQVYRPDAFAGGDWAADCARVFPGCRVLAVGRDALAVVPAPSVAEGK